MSNVPVLNDVLETSSDPIVRRIGMRDIKDALAEGYSDFLSAPTQLFFLGIIYPLVGLIAARAASGGHLLPLLYPLVAGLSLMGPIAAIGIYELSRRREQRLAVSWLNAFDVLRSPAIGAIVALGLLICGIFVAWLFAAQAVYRMTIGYLPPGSIVVFLNRVFTTLEGWRLIIWGNAVGFLFAALVLALTVVSFPLLLDKHVRLRTAVLTSIRVVAINPVTMAVWGLIVAVALMIGCLPLFVGLAVVMPILGHATWRLYRRAVVP